MSHVEFTTDEAYAAYLVGRMERKEAERTGEGRLSARQIIARRMGVAPGTLENIVRGRIKAISTNVYKRIIAAADRELLAEIARLEHERTVVASKAGRADQIDIQQIDAHLAAARAALGGEG